MLRRALDCCTVQSCWRSHPRLLLWTGVVGGIAASSTSHRPWYANRLHKLSTQLRIYDWGVDQEDFELVLVAGSHLRRTGKEIMARVRSSTQARCRITTALESYERNEESGISGTNLVTIEVGMTDIEDKPCQLASRTMNVDTPDSAIVRISWRDYSICSI
jgi:hypothetical protein